MKTQKYNQECGFTLVELLVVIAIIAVLLSVLMPALNKVRTAATAIVCSSHLKDMGTMVEVYATENKGRMVPGYPYGGGRWWDRLGRLYNKKMSGLSDRGKFELFRCPLEKKKKTGLSKNVAGAYGYNSFFACVMLDDSTPANYNDNPPNPNFYYYWWSKRERFKQPSTLPVFFDLNSDPLPPRTLITQGNGYPNFNILKYGWQPSGGARSTKKVTGNLADDPVYPYSGCVSNPDNGPAANHGKYINYVFADGHAGSNGLWPYDQTASPITGQRMSLSLPGTSMDYLTFFHPIRKLYQKGTSGKFTVGDGYTGPLP